MISVDGRSSKALLNPASPLEHNILDTIGAATFSAEMLDDTIALYGMSGNDRDVLHENKIIRSGDNDYGYATMTIQVAGAEGWKAKYWRGDTIMQLDYNQTGFKEGCLEYCKLGILVKKDPEHFIMFIIANLKLIMKLLYQFMMVHDVV